ncbi:MAG: hypothetical protein RTU30_04655, partial [Candidatus Thorarchaeota archaeon]
ESFREEQVFMGVQASLRVRKIGLEMDDFLVKVDSYNSVKQIEKFCDAHPYTSYRARVYGGETQGLILQFRQPDAAREHLIDALNILKQKKIIVDIREIPTLSAEYGSTYTRPRLEAWDPENLVWRFDWDKWWSDAPKGHISSKSPEVQDDERVELDDLDVKLLEEMTKNARRKNTEIIDSIGLDKDKMGVQQKVSQKIKRLDDEAIESYRVFINWTHFDVYNTPLIIANSEESTTSRLITHLESSNFPFGSTIRKTSDGFIWSARLPSAHLSELIALVWKISKSYELLIIDYKHSELYGLWAETFDKEEGTWRTDRAFCLEEPLKTGKLK